MTGGAGARQTQESGVVVDADTWFALALAALDARGVRAQQVDGQILDAGTRAPIGGATLLLLDAQGQTVHRATSDGRGFFTLRGRAPASTASAPLG
jgi:hypothetical protein